MDTTGTAKIDSAIKPITKDSSLKNTVVLPSKPYGELWLNSSRDVIVAYAWPLTAVLLGLILIFKAKSIIETLATYVKEIRFGNFAGVFNTVETKIPGGTNLKEALEKHVGPEEATTSGVLQDPMVKKILATLWDGQKKFGEDYTKRWTFTIPVSDPQFQAFYEAVVKLANKGIIAQAPTTGHFYLTDFGFFVCKKYEKEIGDDRFFK